MQRLTKEQAATIGAYTGVTCGNFADIHEYAEKLLGRPIWTHEFAREELADELREKSKEDFLSLCYEEPKADLPTERINKEVRGENG
jgi:hypothetical protein